MGQWSQVRSCIFCQELLDTRDHLFFAFPYTFTIWSELAATLLGRKLSPDWSTTLRSLAASHWRLVDKTILRMLFQSKIYHLWRERNYRHHQNGFNSTANLVSCIRADIHTRISSLSFPPDSPLGDLSH